MENMETSAALHRAPPMRPDSRIYVAGHRGLVGGAIMRALTAQGFSNILTRAHADLDLCDQAAVTAFLSEAMVAPA